MNDNLIFHHRPVTAHEMIIREKLLSKVSLSTLDRKEIFKKVVGTVDFWKEKVKEYEEHIEKRKDSVYIQTYGRAFRKTTEAKRVALKHIVDNPEAVQSEHFIKYLEDLLK